MTDDAWDETTARKELMMLDWMVWAGCQGLDPDMFFAERGDPASIEAARSVCNRCLVTEECLAYAVAANERHGIWGGLSPRERFRLRAEGRIPRRRPRVLAHERIAAACRAGLSPGEVAAQHGVSTRSVARVFAATRAGVL